MSDGIHLKFWQEAIKEMSTAGYQLFADKKAADRNYLAKSVGISGINYAIVAGQSSWKQSAVRVEIVFEAGDAELNSIRYESLKAKQIEIEKRFGGKLHWNEENNRKKFIIAVESSFASRDDDRKAVALWLGKNITCLADAVKPYLNALSLHP